MANISTIKVGSTSYGIAPASHASTATTYGVGTSLEYGHVKLSDNYTTSDGVADEGVGASSKAVSDAYNEIKAKLGTISEKCEWKDCIVTANSEVGFFPNNVCKAKYRYDSNGDVLELCVRGTYASKAKITKSTTLMTVSGLDIAISANCDSLVWDDTAQQWNRVTLKTNGNITLTSPTYIQTGSWVSCDTLNFIISSFNFLA